MDEVAVLIKAVATLLWPVFAFVVLVVFKEQIRDLLLRLKSGKILGQEIELNESLAELNRSAVEAASEVAALPASVGDSAADKTESDDDLIRRVLEEASRSPKTALLLLSSEMEREVRELLASMGLWGRRYAPLPEAIRQLDANSGLPKHVLSSATLFWQARSRLVHGYKATDDDILSAIDSGITILNALRSIPHEVHTVYHPGVEVYSDPEGKTSLQDVRAVILESRSLGGTSTRRGVYPTTRTHFKRGQRVAWEWSSERKFAESWYRDPDTNKIEYAWTSSMEFVGRHMEDL